MRKILFFPLLALAVPAGATDWRVASLADGPSGRTVTFVDAAKLVRMGSRIRFWRDTRTERPTASGASRFLDHVEVWCDNRSFRYLVQSTFRGEMVIVADRSRAARRIAMPGTPWASAIDSACSGKYLSSRVADRDGYLKTRVAKR